MARPNKQGVDYFPLDVHLDDKFKFIEIKYKLEGFAILVKLFQKIYSCGYWYKWTDDEALLFSDEVRADYQLVVNVVNECLEREVFDKGLHTTYNILTSKGIQKRYKEIVRRRKDVEVIEEYLLIENSFGVNDVINPSESKRDDDKSTQSKVKESKVNKTKEKNSKESYDSSPKQVYDEDSIHYRLALRLYQNILKNNSGHKEPNLQIWANDVRLMMERDKRTEDQIAYLMDWVQNHSFWKTNILSVSKLREKYDQLVIRVKEDINKQNKQVVNLKPKAFQSLEDWAGEA